MAGVPCLLYTIMIVLAMASLLSQGAVAATVQYCADFNTGTDYSSGSLKHDLTAVDRLDGTAANLASSRQHLPVQWSLYR